MLSLLLVFVKLDFIYLTVFKKHKYVYTSLPDLQAIILL